MTTSRMRDKFDRFMDMVKRENQKGVKYKAEQEPKKNLGYFTYNFGDKTETYTPSKEYKEKTNSQ